jgi:hypothetical protein
MRRVMMTCAAAAFAALAAPTPAAAQSGGRLEYAVKFVCGTNARPLSPAAAPGTYYTAINVHVPTGSITFAHLVSLAGPGRPAGHTPVIGTITLNFNDAVDVDCAQIAAELTRGGVTPGPFFTGFFVIQSTSEIDVVAVYTAAATRAGPVVTLATERVPVRRRS